MRLIIIGSLFCAAHQLACAAENRSSSAFQREVLEAQLPLELQKYQAATVGVAVLQDDRILWSGVYGRLDQQHKATSNTLFNVASLAKPLTAQLVLQLASSGKISLDEVISSTWIDPDLKEDPRHQKLTPRLLLSHQSGLPNWRYLASDKKLAFIADPGSSFTYSGEGYEYLRRFIERKLERSFEQLVADYVLNPMGLAEIGFTADNWMNGRIAAPMDEAGKFGEPDLQAKGDPNAADNLFTTVRNYAEFIIRTMRDQTLSDELAAQRFRIYTDASKQAVCKPASQQACPRAAGYGLGWVVFDYGDKTLIWHSGGDNTEYSMAYYIPQTREGAVVFVNGARGQPIILDVVDLIGHEPSISKFMRALEEN